MKSKKYSIDFGDVEGEVGGRRTRRIPEGDYIAKITGVERKKNKAGDAYYFSWKVQVVESASGDTKHKGAPLYYTTSLKHEALWNLRNLIYASTDGKKNVAGKSVDFDPTSLVGKKIGITVEDDEYEGKIRSQIADVVPPSQLQGDEDADDDEDLEDTDDEDDDDLDDVDDEDDDEDDEPVVKKKPKTKKKKSKASDDDEDDDL